MKGWSSNYYLKTLLPPPVSSIIHPPPTTSLLTIPSPLIVPSSNQNLALPLGIPFIY